MNNRFVIVNPCEKKLNAAKKALENIGCNNVIVNTSISEANKDVQKDDVIICNFFGPDCPNDPAKIDDNPDYLFDLCFSHGYGLPSGYLYAYTALRSGAKAALVLADVKRLNNPRFGMGGAILPFVNTPSREYIYGQGVGDGTLYFLDNQAYMKKKFRCHDSPEYWDWDATVEWLLARFEGK